ncbi:MAG: LysR family transcriptional regulator [Bowdeniella nasicola]|nr:LysR family transcriptional regulator [Bowdeniella nasicola]
MELRHINGFVAVAQELHFGRAAARLHIAQPALSQQIAALERMLGVTLFERSTRSVRLSPAGETFLPLAQRILLDVETAVRAVKSGGDLVGRVTIGFAGVSAHVVLPRLARAVRKQHPGIHLRLVGQVYSGEAVNRVAEGTIDLGLVRLPVKRAGLATYTLQRERLLAALPADHRLADREEIDLTELAQEPFVSFPGMGGSAMRAALDHVMQEVGTTPEIVQEAPDSLTILDLVAAGVGVTLTVSSVESRQRSSSEVVFVPLTGGGPIIESAMAWREDNDSPALKAVLDVVRDVIPTPLEPGAYLQRD